MKSIDYAKCVAKLKYNLGSPVVFCQYCDSINVLEIIQFNIDASNSIDGTPSFYEELKTATIMPQEKFMANYWKSVGNSKGGHLRVLNTEIFFKPQQINIGDLSK